ncbi:hypothetical protein LQL77_29905 [Rhodococcus cerastii]|nr:hypothetical protein [Rhodococcus cerastii]
MNKTALVGVAVSMMIAPVVAAAAAHAEPAAPGPGSGYVIEVENEKTNDPAVLVRQMFGNVDQFLVDGKVRTPEVVSPNGKAQITGVKSVTAPNMDFVFRMRDRRVHAWVTSTVDGKIKPWCMADAQAACYFEGLDKDGYVDSQVAGAAPLRLHISYDKAGPQETFRSPHHR